MKYSESDFLLVGRWIRESPVRSLAAVLAVAFAAAFATSVHLAGLAASGSVASSLDRAAGRTCLRLYPSAGDFNENLMADLAWTRRWGALLPVVEGNIAPAAEPEGVLRVLGVDMVRDPAERGYQVMGPDGKALSAALCTQSLARSDALYVSETYAASRGWKIGSRIPFLADGRAVTLTLSGLLAKNGPGGAYGGTQALMDIAAAQELLGMDGRLSSLEWTVKKKGTERDLAAALRKNLPVGFDLETPGNRRERAEAALRPFRFHLAAWSLAGILPGVFVFGSVLLLAALRRRGGHATLRILGVSGRKLEIWFWAEAGFFAALGCLGGLLGGRWGAEAVSSWIGPVVRDLYIHAPLPMEVPSVARGTGWMSGVFLLSMASAYPVIRGISKVPPSFGGASFSPEEAGKRRLRAWAAAGFGLWILSFLLLKVPFLGGGFWGGYAAAAAWLGGIACLAPATLGMALRFLCWLLHRWSPLESSLAVRGLLAGFPGTGRAAGSMALAVGFLVSAVIFTVGCRVTSDDWAKKAYKADLYAQAMPPSAHGGGSLDPAWVAAARGLEGVAALETRRVIEGRSLGKRVTLSAMDMRVAAAYGDPYADSGKILARLPGRLAAVASRSLERRDHLQAGDFFTLDTPTGRVPLEIDGFYDADIREGDSLRMDRGTYRSLFRDEKVDSFALFLSPGASVDQVKAALEKLAGPAGRLSILSGAEKRRQAAWGFGGMFLPAVVLGVLALCAVGWGVFAALTELRLRRAPEIAVLRYLGATRKQVRTIVLWQSVVLGLLGIAWGFLAGGVLGLWITRVIAPQTFGWAVRFLPCGGLLAATAAALVLSAWVGGMIPARQAAEMDALKAVHPE